MAEGKKSFILYTDSYNMIEMLNAEQKGALLDAIFSLHGCCECPELDQATAIVFAGMKRYLLENMEKWEETRRKKSEGAKKARANDAKRKREEAMVKSVEDTSSNLSTLQDGATVNVNVNDNVNVNVNDKEKRKKEKAVTASSDCSAECSTGVEPSLQKSKKEANEHFEKLWALYPAKKGKNLISDKRKRDLLSISVDEMQCFINRYKRDIELDHNNGFARQWLNGSTWFNGRWQDYTDDNYQPAPTVTASKGGARYRSVEGFRDFSDLEE